MDKIENSLFWSNLPFTYKTCQTISFDFHFHRGYTRFWVESDEIQTDFRDSDFVEAITARNPLTPKILFLILPSSCYTFPRDLVTRIWY